MNFKLILDENSYEFDIEKTKTLNYLLELSSKIANQPKRIIELYDQNKQNLFSTNQSNDLLSEIFSGIQNEVTVKIRQDLISSEDTNTSSLKNKVHNTKNSFSFNSLQTILNKFEDNYFSISNSFKEFRYKINSFEYKLINALKRFRSLVFQIEEELNLTETLKKFHQTKNNLPKLKYDSSAIEENFKYFKESLIKLNTKRVYQNFIINLLEERLNFYNLIKIPLEQIHTMQKNHLFLGEIRKLSSMSFINCTKEKIENIKMAVHSQRNLEQSFSSLNFLQNIDINNNNNNNNNNIEDENHLDLFKSKQPSGKEYLFLEEKKRPIIKRTNKKNHSMRLISISPLIKRKFKQREELKGEGILKVEGLLKGEGSIKEEGLLRGEGLKASKICNISHLSSFSSEQNESLTEEECKENQEELTKDEQFPQEQIQPNKKTISIKSYNNLEDKKIRSLPQISNAYRRSISTTNVFKLNKKKSIEQQTLGIEKEDNYEKMKRELGEKVKVLGLNKSMNRYKFSSFRNPNNPNNVNTNTHRNINFKFDFLI